jgi:hypothetical protein
LAPVNLHNAKFQAVLERETISKNILEKGFSYNLSHFSKQTGFLCAKIEKVTLLKGIQTFLEIGHIGTKNREFYADFKM